VEWANVAEKNQLCPMLKDLATLSPTCGTTICGTAEKPRIHEEVRDFSYWTPIEKVRQHAMVDGDSA
jgi:hypothetical protein